VLTDARRAPLRRALQDAVAAGVTPGAVLGWAVGDEPPEYVAVGSTAWPGQGLPITPVTPATIYDLASLTKPLLTTAAAMLLVARGRITLTTSLADVLVGWRGEGRELVRLDHLLGHEAGLVWWLPFYRQLLPTPPVGPAPWPVGEGGVDDPPAARWARLSAALLQVRPEQPPGTAGVYSDPGFLLLGWALAQVAGEPLADLVGRELWEPWAATGLTFVSLGPGGPPGRWAVTPVALGTRGVVAPTERCPWRQRLLHGEVHDENASYLGGIAPHAGLFGTAADLLGFGRGLLRARADRSPETLPGTVVRSFWEGGSRPAGSTWALGWDRPTPGSSAGGRRISPGAVGHLGFTGVSLWIDPARDAVVTLLTNRVHPTRAGAGIKELRSAVHDLLWDLLDGRAPAAG